VVDGGQQQQQQQQPLLNLQVDDVMEKHVLAMEEERAGKGREKG
jgi:hypothetical protein